MGDQLTPPSPLDTKNLTRCLHTRLQGSFATLFAESQKLLLLYCLILNNTLSILLKKFLKVFIFIFIEHRCCWGARCIREFVDGKKNEPLSLIQNKIWRQIVLFAQIFRVLVKNIFMDGQPW